MADSPYMPGYEGWELFDELPDIVKAAHNVVWTGRPIWANQFRTTLLMTNLSENDARAIVELDDGKMLLSSADCGVSDEFGVFY
jgi:hypothetical protein